MSYAHFIKRDHNIFYNINVLVFFLYEANTCLTILIFIVQVLILIFIIK